MLFEAELSPPNGAEDLPTKEKQESAPQDQNLGASSTLDLRAERGASSIQPRRSLMQVRKRNGDLEAVDVNKIVRAIDRCVGDLNDVDPMRVATRTISGLYDGATTAELDELSIQTAAGMISEEPEYSQLAARLLANYIHKEVRGLGVATFSQSIALGEICGLIRSETASFVQENARKLDYAIKDSNDDRFQFFGIKTVYDRYLLRHPQRRSVIETPQFFFMRVACGLSNTPNEAINFYNLISSLAYLPSSPTLFNSGTKHTQMSSCYLIDSPQDDLDSIYERYGQVAKLSKFAGGIGIGFSRVRSRGSLIRGTNGKSNGIVPFIKTLDASVAAVNQGGKRKGAACVYLEPWHPDIEEFLELRDNTGEESRRTHNINIANWISDEFMRRVEEDEPWSLIDPDTAPELVDLWGDDFTKAYRSVEAQGLAVKTIGARELYGKMMRTLAQTGNGWMTFKDASNAKCNQTLLPKNVVHLSNLCTEITEVTSNDETAVCNLGSVNLAQHITYGEDGTSKVDVEKLRSTVRTAVIFLDRVIDINFYPSDEAARSNPLWRPVGLGVMGLQDLFFAMRLPFDSEGAARVSTEVAEEIYLTALETSNELAREYGSFPRYNESRTSAGQLQLDLWDTQGTQIERWASLRNQIANHGLRNSLLIAIAPTATIASIAGCYECIEPQVSNLYKRETLSGEFMQVNNALVRELKSLDLWNDEIRDKIKRANGSIQDITEIPAEVRSLFRTAWELPQRALIDLAARRGPFVDQSQSLNLFIETPTIGKLSSMYLYAWKAGLKSTYYLRSRPASRIAQATIGESSASVPTEPRRTTPTPQGSSTTSPTSKRVETSRSQGVEFAPSTNPGAAGVSKGSGNRDGYSVGIESSSSAGDVDSPSAIPSNDEQLFMVSDVAVAEDEPTRSMMIEVAVTDIDNINTISNEIAINSADISFNEDFYDAAAIACSLENPETCEACQ